MLKVFNRNPHFMRDAVIVDSYADAWDIICSMQERIGQRILLVGRETWGDLGFAEYFTNFVWTEDVKTGYIISDKSVLFPAPSKYNRCSVLKLIKAFGINYSIREIG